MKSSSPEVSSILDSSSVSSESYSDSVSELSRTTSSFLFLELLLVILPMLKSREFFDNCVYRGSPGVFYISSCPLKLAPPHGNVTHSKT